MERVQSPPQSRRSAPLGTCLIVEDSQFDSLRLTRIVSKAIKDMPVQVAPTLAAARELMQEHQMEVILLDNNLPDGLGADFAVELSEDDAFKHIPKVMVSDWPSPFMFDKAERAGVLFVISKTEFDSRYLHAALKERRKRRVPTH